MDPVSIECHVRFYQFVTTTNSEYIYKVIKYKFVFYVITFLQCSGKWTYNEGKAAKVL